MKSREEWILIMGGGLLTVPMYKACKRLGLKILGFEWRLDTPGLAFADDVIHVNLKDIVDVREKAKLAGEKHPIGGVVTCGADIEVAVAAAAETLGLPGIPLEVANTCNDKSAMRKKLSEADIDNTLWAEVRSKEEAVYAAGQIGFPCFIKPVDNCGSRGCRPVHSTSDILEWWEELTSFSVNGERRALLEEYIDGPRQTVEMVVYKGEIHLLSIIDTHYIYEEPERYPYGQWPVETGLNTTALPIETQDELFEYSKRVVRTIGVDWGPVKVDTTITNSGFKTIELTARLSGGFHCQYATPIAYGTDEITAVAKLAMGEPLDRNLIEHRYERASVVQAIFPNPGKIISISGVEEALSLQGVKEVIFFRNIGDMVPAYRNSTDRVGFVIAGGEDLDEARAFAEAGVSSIDIRTR